MKPSAWFLSARKGLEPAYGLREAEQLSQLLLESVTGLSRVDRILNKEQDLDSGQSGRLQQGLDRLKAGEPIQYILGESWFLGRRFRVRKGVLIPRPETEELVLWACQQEESLTRSSPPPALLDIGTGSGCIALSMKARFPGSLVYALDISRPALEIARENASLNQAEIELRQGDILDESCWEAWPVLDLIISNPPYISSREKAGLPRHVRDREPPEALFVPGEDPLLFYRVISARAPRILRPGGWIYLEIHELRGPGVLHIFREAGYRELVLKKDLFGKDRFLRARMP